MPNLASSVLCVTLSGYRSILLFKFSVVSGHQFLIDAIEIVNGVANEMGIEFLGSIT